MQIHTIDTGLFKLDGGAMFGVVPKTMWQKLVPADDNNKCTWAMRCLLVESGKRLLLIDTGMGDKQDTRFKSIFEPHGDGNLIKSIKQKGYSPDDITDVLLTHLHFDHCGGAIERDSSNELLKPIFNNATYWTSKKQWDWAINPNLREKASFLKENILPIQESGQLKFTENEDLAIEGIQLHYVNGHTESMILPEISYKNTSILYAADLIPSSHHIGLPYIMGYDVRPLDTLNEKIKFLDIAEKKSQILIFEHDANVGAGTLKRTDRGIVFDEPVIIEEL